MIQQLPHRWAWFVATLFIATPLFAQAQQQRDVVVETIVESQPRTPRDLLRAAVTLATIDRADLAKEYLKQIVTANLQEADLAALASVVEPAELLRMAANEKLLPEGRAVADAILAARANQVRDPRRLQGVVNQLASNDRSQRRQALVELLAAKDDAVPPLVIALGDANRASVHAAARQALVELGSQAIPPLLAVLESEDAKLKVQVIDVLVQLDAREAVLPLIAPAVREEVNSNLRLLAKAALRELMGVEQPTAESGAKLLRAEAERYLKRERPLTTDADGLVTVWQWNPRDRAPVRVLLPRDMASYLHAARLANDLFSITPDDAAARRLFLLSTLQAAAVLSGPDDQLPAGANSPFERAARLGPNAIEETLDEALRKGYLPAATAAARILGVIGNRDLLRAEGAQVRPLVTAVAHGDRRVRFAAAEAIMKFQPTAGFAGSSDLLKTLAFFAGSPGERRALVAFPNAAIAAQLAGMLASLGYEVDQATTGRQAYLQALASGDYELIVLSGRLDHPPTYVLLQELRREPRTARLPIALLAEEEDVERLELLARDDALTTSFLRPLTPEGMKFFVDKLLAKTAGNVVPAELRAQQAAASLAWLTQLFEANPAEFNVRPYEAAIAKSLNSPPHSAAAAELLALIGTHSAQRTLLHLANNNTMPLPMRQAAAAAFSKSVRQRGIQLTSREILDQYDRYNASAVEDAASQQLLALVLDAIEEPTRK